MAGITIHGLTAIPLSDFTSTDELPVWDTGAGSGQEPTMKITAQNLAKGLILLLDLYTDVTVGTITIGNGGYTSISSYIPSGITPIAVSVLDFGSATGAITITANGNYALGSPGVTMTNVKLRYYYRG